MNPIGTINEILTQKGTTVWRISPEATVFEAIQMMADKNIGALLVTDKEKLLGLRRSNRFVDSLGRAPAGVSRIPW